MFPVALNTNEVKNSLGTEVEFQLWDKPSRGLIYQKTGESPAYTSRIGVNHAEVGTGLNKRRRSRLYCAIESPNEVDATAPKVTNLVYAVADVPIGGTLLFTQITLAMAHLNSLLSSRGVSTTILYDGTGVGAESLINGSL